MYSIYIIQFLVYVWIYLYFIFFQYSVYTYSYSKTIHVRDIFIQGEGVSKNEDKIVIYT